MDVKNKDHRPLFIVILVVGTIITILAMFFFATDTPTQAHEYYNNHHEPTDGWYWIGYDPMYMKIPQSDYEDECDTNLFRQSWVFSDSDCMQLVEPDNEYVRQIAEHIQSKYEGRNELKLADKVSKFVWQNIEYATDPQTYGMDDYWATPTETLYVGRGDCEDLSILTCSILIAAGLDGVLLHYDGHYAPGVIYDGQTYSLDGGCDPNLCLVFEGNYPTVITETEKRKDGYDPVCATMYGIKDTVLDFFKAIRNHIP